LRLIFDVVQNPTFPESEIALLRQQFVGNIEQAKDTPATLADQHADNVFYGNDDVRGRTMSHASLAKIARSHLVDFHKRWFAPNNAILAVSGDFDPKQIESAFSTWKKKEVPVLPKFETPKVSPLKIRVVDKPDATQSTIVIMGPGIRHAAPDFYAVKLMNYALGGGGFSSRLMKVVRSEGGKTYGANSSFSTESDSGDFTVSTFTRNAETAATLKLVFGEIEKMQKSGPTSDELDAAKGKIIGGFGLQLETGSDLADQLLLSNIHGLSNDYVSKYPQRMLNVTLEEAKKAAADHLSPTTLVVLGNAKEITPLLTEIGYAPHETVSYLDPVAKE
jgi:zinc protease